MGTLAQTHTALAEAYRVAAAAAGLAADADSERAVRRRAVEARNALQRLRAAEKCVAAVEPPTPHTAELLDAIAAARTRLESDSGALVHMALASDSDTAVEAPSFSADPSSWAESLVAGHGGGLFAEPIDRARATAKVQLTERVARVSADLRAQSNIADQMVAAALEAVCVEEVQLPSTEAMLGHCARLLAAAANSAPLVSTLQQLQQSLSAMRN
jgi:hypothetical protein